MSQLQVQDSSGCCINSKYSSACKGYFKDDYISLFTDKLFKRSPIINRGYYIRFKAMEEVFQSWTSCAKLHTYKRFQIISLGAGYDSSYLRLKNNNSLPAKCHYIEIDFYDVLKKKYQCIKKVLFPENEILLDRVDFQDPAIVLCTEEYSLLGIDLTDISSLQKNLEKIGVSYDLPTLFLSECSITYINPQCSDKLIKWIQSQFQNAVFVTYEQIYPDDAFGIVMQNHFIQVGCPLKSISKYPSEEAQCERFKKLGWFICSAMNMFEFFSSLPAEEKYRVAKLELFDEYEMWHEKCLHYVLVWASQGIFSQLPCFFTSTKRNNQVINDQQKYLVWRKLIAKDIVNRFGHQMIPFSSNSCFVSGGFGVHNKRHQRLEGIVLYDIANMKYSNVILHSKEYSIGNRMFHTLTKISNDAIVILGGRASPNKIFEEVLILEKASKTDKVTEISDISFDVFSRGLCMPVPTWRHSASLVHIKGCEYIVVFGGCTVNGVVTSLCFKLSTSTWEWSNVNEQYNAPSACHSHSSVTYNESYVIISGGLSKDETVLDSVYMLDCQQWKWTLLDISGMLPRYSHTSHIWKDQLILVGGISPYAQRKLGVGIINLNTFQALEIQPPAQDPEYPILLTSHASYLSKDEIIIVGGGGNCFSFGTHFNRNIVIIDCKSFLQ